MADGTGTQLGATIRAELARRDFSQMELAAHLHRSQPWVSRRLRGLRHFTLPELELIAEFLGVPLSSLLPGGDRRAV